MAEHLSGAHHPGATRPGVPGALDPELLARWMARGPTRVTRVEVDERAGGHYRIWQADPSQQACEYGCGSGSRGRRDRLVGFGEITFRRRSLRVSSDR